MNLDIDFNRCSDVKSEKMTIFIKPQGALHMSVSLGGRYNNTVLLPTENMIYGLLENIIGLHIDLDTRKKIKKSIKSKNKTQTSGQKSFMPMSNEFIDIKNIELISDNNEFFDDLSRYLYNRTDKPHFTGAANVDISYYYEERKDYSKDSDKSKEEHLYKFPEFYSGIIKKQYVIIDGYYKIDLELSEYFKNILINSIDSGTSAYLGSSESIVNVYLNKEF